MCMSFSARTADQGRGGEGKEDQVMKKAIAHHQLTNAQSDPKQLLQPLANLPSFIVQHDII